MGGGGRRRVVIASPHRHADLARLWHRSIARDLAPALARVGLDVDVTIFCDAGTANCAPRSSCTATIPHVCVVKSTHG